MSLPILVLDFDGVIHSYTSGWQGADVVSDPPVDGVIEFIIAASKHFTVAVYSSRSGQPGGIEAMHDYLKNHWIDNRYDSQESWDIFNVIKWPTEKPPAFLTIDDRAMLFEGKWPSIKELVEFKPWYKK